MTIFPLLIFNSTDSKNTKRISQTKRQKGYKTINKSSQVTRNPFVSAEEMIHLHVYGAGESSE